jgi:hypothetical protein
MKIKTNERQYNGDGVLVADASNPSYSGGRDQEDHSSKPDQASLQDAVLKIPNTKKGWQNGSSSRTPA